jgi:phenylacetate-CoA ligase
MDTGGGRSQARIDNSRRMLERNAATIDRWNALLDRARDRVPLYRARLPKGGIDALEQVADLPFTTKEDFRRAYPLDLLAVPRSEVVRLHMSSGTTGRPVVTAYTRADLELWGECMERVLAAAGVGPTDVAQNAYGYGLFTGGMGFHLGAERIGCTVVPTSSGVTQRQVLLLRDLGTTVLLCTPSFALVLAEVIADAGALGELSLRAGFFGAEPWTDDMRREIERGLGLEAFDNYGLTELGGPGVAVECTRHDGMHIFEDHFYAEVIDPESGRPLPAGRPGELVLTSLRREASPVIRYRTRDRTVLVEEPCSCGNPYRRMRKVHGRTDDMLVIRGENVFPSQIESILLQVEGLTANYQLVVDRQAHHLDTLQIRVEAGAGADHVGLRERAEERIRETIGLRTSVTVLAPGVLPRSEGKARRVIDLREL